MGKEGSILLAVIMLIIGLAIGFGVTRMSDRHRESHRKLSIAGHDQRAARHSVSAQSNDKWDPMAEMERMQQDIDRSIQRATQQMRIGSFNLPDLANGGTSGYTSALDVRDRGDHFEVRADLPNADKKDVKVTAEGNRELHVSVTEHQEQKKDENGGQATYRQFGSYDQLVTLPEAADMKDMKVDNQNGELVITIPKAKAS